MKTSMEYYTIHEVEYRQHLFKVKSAISKEMVENSRVVEFVVDGLKKFEDQGGDLDAIDRIDTMFAICKVGYKGDSDYKEEKPYITLYFKNGDPPKDVDVDIGIVLST